MIEARWQRVQAAVWLLVGIAVAGAGAPRWLPTATAGLLLLSYGYLFVRISAWRLADLVTLARVIALAVWVLVIAGQAPVDATALAIGAWLLAVAAIAADLLDGFVARRFGPTSAGALLDMEADQAATLSLSIVALVPCGVGWWALLLPAFRFTFVLLGWLLALPAHDPKPKAGDNRRARRICALTMGLQLLAIAPFVANSGRNACIVIASAALAYSYSDDLRYLLRQRALRHQQ